MYTVRHPVSGDREYETVLDAISQHHVFSVEPLIDGGAEITEECDHYYSVVLTKEQLIALADELRALANGA